MHRSQLGVYLNHLAEADKLDFDKLSYEEMTDISIHMLREMPTKYIPHIEQNDHSREIMMMMINWMETENEDLGSDILSKMKESIIHLLEPDIAGLLENHAIREARANEQARKDHAADIAADNRQRI